MVVNLCILGFRMPVARDTDPKSLQPFPTFLAGYVQAYTLGLHVGFLLGNGLHAVHTNRCVALSSFRPRACGLPRSFHLLRLPAPCSPRCWFCSPKIMQLYFWAKCVFSSLTLLETGAMIVSVLSPGTLLRRFCLASPGSNLR